MTKLIEHMKGPNQDNIYLEDFREFCSQFPSAMDFIAKITIGNHPAPFTAYQDLEDIKSKQKAIGYLDNTDSSQSILFPLILKQIIVIDYPKQDSPHGKYERKSSRDIELFQRRWVKMFYIIEIIFKVPRTSKPGI